MQARFLKGDDKLLAIERVRMNQMGISSDIWRWDHVKEVFLDLKTWLWFSMLAAVSIPYVHRFPYLVLMSDEHVLWNVLEFDTAG